MGSYWIDPDDGSFRRTFRTFRTLNFVLLRIDALNQFFSFGSLQWQCQHSQLSSYNTHSLKSYCSHALGHRYRCNCRWHQLSFWSVCEKLWAFSRLQQNENCVQQHYQQCWRFFRAYTANRRYQKFALPSI